MKQKNKNYISQDLMAIYMNLKVMWSCNPQTRKINPKKSKKCFWYDYNIEII